MKITKNSLVDDKNKIIDEKFILAHLRNTVEIDQDVTLGDLFLIVSKYQSLKTFISQYSWCESIEEFHKQAKEKNKDKNNNIEYLEIGWSTEMYEINFNICSIFHGIGKPEQPEYANSDGKCNYSVSYSPMYELADKLIKLNKNVKIYDYSKKEFICEGSREFSLLDVLDAIYWDISFMGSPDDNKNFLEEMNQRVKEIKNELNKPSQ